MWVFCPVIISSCPVVLLHKHYDWLGVAVFKLDWLHVYTSEGG